MIPIHQIENTAVFISGRRDYIPPVLPMITDNTCQGQSSSLGAALGVDITTMHQVVRVLSEEKDRFEMRRVTGNWTRNIKRPSMVTKSVEDVLKRMKGPDWAPRIAMFLAAMGSGSRASYTHVFSLSVEPVDSAIEQALYWRNSGKKNPYMSVISESCGVESYYSKKEVDSERPAPVLRGFVKPYRTFSSPDITPELDPFALPPDVERVYLMEEGDIEAAVADVHPQEVRERVALVAKFFFQDIHAQSLCLVVLQPYHTPAAPMKRIFFTKHSQMSVVATES